MSERWRVGRTSTGVGSRCGEAGSSGQLPGGEVGPRGWLRGGEAATGGRLRGGEAYASERLRGDEVGDTRGRKVNVCRRLALVAGLLSLFAPQPILAQSVSTPADDAVGERVGLFLDCNVWSCDRDFFRQGIDFVNWVREPADADVHVLITSQETGGGGQAYSLDFLGRGAFTGQDLDLTYTSAATDTEDEIRRGIARTLRLGLAPYAAGTASANQLDVVYEAADGEEAAAPAAPAQDPWNLWVFNTRVDGSVEAESLTEELDVGGFFSANRTTPLWKHGFSVRLNYRNDSRTYEDDGQLRSVDDIRHSIETVATSVRSVGGRWSAGLRSAASSATEDNLDFEFFAGPAIEYSFFPYEDFTRRQLVLFYTLSGGYVDYLEETIFDQTHEMLYRQSLALAYAATQPWGEARASISGSHYLHDFSKYNVQLDGSLDFRIVRGLSLDVSGEVGWIRDQLSLPKEDASLEDVLLERRELATNYRYQLELGLNFRFGSPFNNVVNPRLDDLEWGF